ncbi:MAG: hypothetical protein U0V48_01510 [Anaerolineales bacterium]
MRLARKQGIDATMKKCALDAIVVPSGGPAWVIDLANGDAINWDMDPSPAAVAGYPHITMPAGYVFGLRWEFHFSQPHGRTDIDSTCVHLRASDSIPQTAALLADGKSGSINFTGLN